MSPNSTKAELTNHRSCKKRMGIKVALIISCHKLLKNYNEGNQLAISMTFLTFSCSVNFNNLLNLAESHAETFSRL